MWAYLTDPAKLAIWFHKPKTALVEGDYEMFGIESGDKLMWGTVLVAEPFSRLEYTFTIAPMGDQTSTVKWLLEEVPGGTNYNCVTRDCRKGQKRLVLSSHSIRDGTITLLACEPLLTPIRTTSGVFSRITSAKPDIRGNAENR